MARKSATAPRDGSRAAPPARRSTTHGNSEAQDQPLATRQPPLAPSAGTHPTCPLHPLRRDDPSAHDLQVLRTLPRASGHGREQPEHLRASGAHRAVRPQGRALDWVPRLTGCRARLGAALDWAPRPTGPCAPQLFSQRADVEAARPRRATARTGSASARRTSPNRPPLLFLSVTGAVRVAPSGAGDAETRA